MILRGPKQDPEFVSRHVTYRQVGRALSSKETENTSVGAGMETVKMTREAVIYYRQGKRSIKRFGNTGKSRNGDAKASEKFRFKADIKSIAAATLKNSAVAVTESIYTPDITDSGMGSISLSAKSVIGAKEAGMGLHSTIKKSRQTFHYVSGNRHTAREQNRSNLNKSNRRAAATVKNPAASFEKTKGNVIRTRTKKDIGRLKTVSSNISKLNLVDKGTTILKAFAVKPSNLLLIGVAFIFLILFLSIASSTGAAGSAPANFLLADENVVQQYIEKIDELDLEQKAKIEGYKSDSRYDDVVIEWMSEIGEVRTNWQEIISIIAVEFEQDVTFSVAEQDRLSELYNRLNYLKTRSETYRCSGCETDQEGHKYCPGHLRLYVQVYSLDMEEIIDNIGLEEWEKDWVRTLVTSDWAAVFPGLANISQNELSASEIAELMKSAPTCSATREEIRQSALSLVGRVGYFWGGKSPAGWNDKWGHSIKVTARGSSTTGTFQPYGLDCSGFTDWVYKTAGVGNILSGGGSSFQWSQSYAIPKSELKVGDLVFKLKPGTSGTNHVGIYVGKDEDGNYLYCHCAYSQGVVVNSYKGFKYFRRPYVNFGE